VTFEEISLAAIMKIISYPKPCQILRKQFVSQIKKDNIMQGLWFRHTHAQKTSKNSGVMVP